jgi:hypothetical protein
MGVHSTPSRSYGQSERTHGRGSARHLPKPLPGRTATATDSLHLTKQGPRSEEAGPDVSSSDRHFGSPSIHAGQVALRPRLTPGLPFRWQTTISLFTIFMPTIGGIIRIITQEGNILLNFKRLFFFHCLRCLQSALRKLGDMQQVMCDLAQLEGFLRQSEQDVAGKGLSRCPVRIIMRCTTLS